MVKCAKCREEINFEDSVEFHKVKNWKIQEAVSFCDLDCLKKYLEGENENTNS